MQRCKLCLRLFATKINVDGRLRNLQNRRYCFTCSPFGAHNTRALELSPGTREVRAAEVRRAKYRKYQRKTRRLRKRLLVQLLGGRCGICGYDKDCPAAYSFHHRDPASKKFEISTRGLLGRWDELLAEVRKCVLLCCRCHAELHAGLHKEWEHRCEGQVAQLVVARP